MSAWIFVGLLWDLEDVDDFGPRAYIHVNNIQRLQTSGAMFKALQNGSYPCSFWPRKKNVTNKTPAPGLPREWERRRGDLLRSWKQMPKALWSPLFGPKQ